MVRWKGNTYFLALPGVYLGGVEKIGPIPKYRQHGFQNLGDIFFPEFSRFSRQNFQKFPDIFTRQF